MPLHLKNPSLQNNALPNEPSRNDSLTQNAPNQHSRVPQYIEGSTQPLGIHSTLIDLARYSFSITTDYPIQSLIERFTQFPDLPGAILLEMEQVSVLSRRHFLECWLQLSYTHLLAEGTVRLLLNQTNRKPRCLPASTPILTGAQQLLSRSHKQQSEPILIDCNGQYQLLDPHVLNVAHWQIRGIETQIRYERLQIQLLQSEKMAALGRLVDGVSHEILDPVGFIWGNLSYIDTYVQQQQQLLKAYEAVMPDLPASIVQLQQDIELDYLRSDLPAAIKKCSQRCSPVTTARH